MKKTLLFLTVLSLASCGGDPKVDINANSDLKNLAEFPKYGNYCGLSRPAAGETPSSIDAVDAACKNHDLCYTQKGNFNLTCDTMIIVELKNITPKTEPEKVARKSIISYFRNSPQKKLMEVNMDNMD